MGPTSNVVAVLVVWQLLVWGCQGAQIRSDQVKVDKQEEDPLTFLNVGRLNTQVGYYGYRIVLKPEEQLYACEKVAETIFEFAKHIQSELPQAEIEKMFSDNYLEAAGVIEALDREGEHLAADSLRLLRGSVQNIGEAKDKLLYSLRVAGVEIVANDTHEVVKRGAGTAAGVAGVISIIPGLVSAGFSIHNFLSFGSSIEALNTRVLTTEVTLNQINDEFGASMIDVVKSVANVSNFTQDIFNSVETLTRAQVNVNKNLLKQTLWIKLKSKIELTNKASSLCAASVEKISSAVDLLRTKKIDPKMISKKMSEDIFRSVKEKAKEEGLSLYYTDPSQLFDSSISYVFHEGKFEITIHIPVLHEENFYDIFHYLPFPIGHPEEGYFYQFRPSMDVIATKTVDKLKRYIVTSYSELAKCKRSGNDYLCSDFNPPFLPMDRMYLDPETRCLVEMFEGNVDPAAENCDGEKVKTFFKVQSVDGRKYYLATPMPKKLQVFCDGKFLGEDQVDYLATYVKPEGCDFTFGPFTTDKEAVAGLLPMKTTNAQISHFTALIALYSANVTAIRKEEAQLNNQDLLTWTLFKESRANTSKNTMDLVKKITEKVQERVTSVPKISISQTPWSGFFSTSTIIISSVVAFLCGIVVLTAFRYYCNRRGQTTYHDPQSMAMNRLPLFQE